MDRIKKKLREASFFLGKLAQQSKLAFGDRETFDSYLSAFLSAARSVDYRLRHEEALRYGPFRRQWDDTLASDEQALVKAMVDDRNLEIHESGSARVEGDERIPVLGSYADASGQVTVAAPAHVPADRPAAEVIRPTFSIVIGGKTILVVEACTSYLKLLERMVADFCRHVGVP